jgi:hypothetical protein
MNTGRRNHHVDANHPQQIRSSLERRLRALVEDLVRDHGAMEQPPVEADLDELLHAIRRFAARTVDRSSLPELPGNSAIASLMAPKNCSFSGRTDFISIEDVLQMLAAGKHSGCLSIETKQDRVDVWLSEGRIAFLDPYRIERRQLPASDPADLRQLPAGELEAARAQRATHGMPLLLHLHANKQLRSEDLAEMLALCGKDALFAMIRETGSRAFSFHSLALPAHAVQFDLCLGVTSALLEGSRLADDWSQIRRVFPDATIPVRALRGPETLAGDDKAGPLTIRVAMELDGLKGPAAIAAAVGLPLLETCIELVRLARMGVVEPPGGADVLAAVEADLDVPDQPALPPFAARPCMEPLEQGVQDEDAAQVTPPAPTTPRTNLLLRLAAWLGLRRN